MRVPLPFAFACALMAVACAGPSTTAPTAGPVADSHRHGGWDSQDGNPTHATHSYLMEFAIDQLRGTFPEVQTYGAQLIDGANRELHDLPVSNAEQEALRIESGGNNWACARPEVYWIKARERYAAGDKAKAYWLLGILLHHVQDMGTPAHGFHVYHQSSPWNWDDFEVMATQGWYPSYSAINRTNPNFSSPDQYVVWNGEWAKSDFNATWPGVTYTRTFYSTSWFWASSKEKTFMKNRQGRTAYTTMWALRSAVTHW
ncbi:MAG TPA: hypothetical protein VEI97_07960 [bacterium]|nr:hypothetical protein [bacterium]